MSSSAEFYSFSLSGRLLAVGLFALTRLSTVIYMNCAIKLLYLLRQLYIYIYIYIYILSDKTWVFDQSQRAPGPIFI